MTAQGEAGPARKRRIVLAACACAAAASLSVGAWFWFVFPDRPREVEAGGVVFTTNVEISEFGGVPYAHIPVNSEAKDLVIEMKDQADTEQLRERLEAIDMLIPGEYAVELSFGPLRIIVDGIED